jgi:hypothetical protein
MRNVSVKLGVHSRADALSLATIARAAIPTNRAAARRSASKRAIILSNHSDDRSTASAPALSSTG